MDFVKSVLAGKFEDSADPNVWFVKRIVLDIREGKPVTFHGKMRIRDVRAIERMVDRLNQRTSVVPALPVPVPVQNDVNSLL